MDDEFDVSQGVPYPSKRFLISDLLVVTLRFAQTVVEAGADALDSLVDLAAMHANYQVDQRNLARQMAYDIEAITSGPIEEE